MKTIGWKALNLSTILAIALAGALAVARPARADTLSVSADLPVSSSVTLKSSGGTSTTYDSKSISGVTLGLSFPFLIGVGYENYSSSFSKTGTKFDYDVMMYDIFVNLPIPVVNIAIGAGAGTGKFANVNTPGFSSPFKDADLTQWFASLGYPILPLVDLHIGYHSFSGKNKATSAAAAAGFSDVNVDGSMYSLGVKIGF
jgi:hypothetical protein